MGISIHTIRTVVDVPISMLIEDSRAAMTKNAELQMLQAHVIREWIQNNDELKPSLGKYWPIRYDLEIIHRVAMEGK